MPIQEVPRLRVPLLAILLVLATALAGCGSSGSDSSSTQQAASPRTFQSKTKDKEALRFGKPSNEAERRAASAVLAANFAAREQGDWATQCETLSQYAIKQLERERKRKTCVAGIEVAAKPLARSKKARLNTLGDSIGLLRVEGSRAIALFHGTDGSDYAMKMEREPAGEWKVGALTAIELTPPPKKG